LASLGAISTLLLLAFPTFVQQAVQIRTKYSDRSGIDSASVPRATWYDMSNGPGDSTNSYYDYAELGTWFTSSYMDVYLKAAIEAGLLVDGSASHNDVPSHCGSERCSWLPYHTIAVCSRVDDVTDELIRNDQYRPYIELGEDHTATKKNKLQATGTFKTRSKFFGADRYSDTDLNITKVARARATPNNSDTNLPDLAHVYLEYYDPCLGNASQLAGTGNEAWKAHRAVFNLCVQTHNVSYNASGMHTNVLSENINLKWDNVTAYEGLSEYQQYCTGVPGFADRFCLRDSFMTLIGGQLAITLDIGAYWGGRGDHYYVYSNWAPNLGRDVLGRDPGICITDESLRMRGYERRISSIAISLSNA
jgi:hypothetical protein